MLRVVRSETLTKDLEAIVMSGDCETGSYIVDCVIIIKTLEKFKFLNHVPSYPTFGQTE